MSKTKCDYLRCDSVDPLIVIVQVDGFDFGVCAKHEKVIEGYGAEMIVDGDTMYVFSPAEIDGYV